MEKLVITGSEGVIGRILSQHLSQDYDIYGIDITEKKEDNYFKADISDLDSLRIALEQVGEFKYLIHLAADSKVNASWDSVLKNNIIGTKNVYECAGLFNVQRVIFASSNHVTGVYEGIPPTLHQQENPIPITINHPVRPDGDYGSSKAHGEALARQYHELYGINSICLRIGTVTEQNDPSLDKTRRMLKTWLSHRDLVQLVKKSLSSDVEFGIYYAISNNTGRFWDISKAERELGYKPEDDGSKWQ